MKLKNIKIINYKSLQHANIESMNHLNVFLGVNGAGKSNFFEVFNFVKSLINKESLIEYVQETCGTSHINMDSNDLTNANIEIFMEIEDSDCSQIAYRIKINDKKLCKNQCAINIESEEIISDSGNVIFANNGDISKINANNSPQEQQLVNFFNNTIVYNFYSCEFFAGRISLYSDINNLKLQTNLSNLGSVLYHIKNNYQDSYNNIIILLTFCK